MLELKVLVLELCAIDRLATSAVALGKVTTLDHELLDNTVERRILVAKSLFPSSQGTEVLSRLRDSLSVQSHDNTAQWLATMLNIEVDLVGDLGAFCRLGGLGEKDQADSNEEGEGDETPQVKHVVCKKPTSAVEGRKDT
uniref:Uncharacterized protein n=1 Tax=Photinus pyralis TaxID=7054 RepID=A0A1Y1L0Z6_PHOPY